LNATTHLRGSSTLSFQWPIDELFDDALFDSSQHAQNDDPFNDSNDDEANKEDNQENRLTASNDNMNFPSGPTPSSSSSGQFKITLMNMGSDKTYNHIFEKAARRWEQIIIGDLPDVPKQSSSSHSWFGSDFDKRVNIDIDDILIGYGMERIDGEGKVLGYAGPVFKKQEGNSIRAISGIMKFDKDDFDK
jgi:hypothetical protein